MSEVYEVAMPTPRPALPAQLLALVAPDLGMERVARTGRIRWPLLFAIVCALLAGGAESLRVDAREQTLIEIEKGGQLKNTSDRQIEDQTKSAERAFIVKRVASSVLKMPLLFAGSLLGLYVVAWFLRGRSKGTAMLAVASAALIPHALAELLSGAAAFLHTQITPDHDALIPRSLKHALLAAGLQLPDAAARLGSALDFFSLWAALLLAFGLGPAANLPRGKSVAGVLVAWLLWRLLTQVAIGG